MGFGQIEKELGKGSGSVPYLHSDCHPGQAGIGDVLPQTLIEEDHIGITKVWPRGKEVYGIKVFRRCDYCGASTIMSHQEQEDGKLIILKCPKCEEQMFFRKMRGLI